MSLRLGMILSNDFNEQNLNYFREKYHYKFILKTNNKFYKEQIKSDEILIEPTGLGDDSETGIGSYIYYKQDPQKIFSNIRAENMVVYNSFVKEFSDRKKHYMEDAVNWQKIIKEMKSEYFLKVGIFFFDGYAITEKVNFPIFTRRVCNVNSLTPEDLMKIKENEILFFV